MKTTYLIIALLMTVSVTAFAQPADKWRISVNNKKISDGVADAPGEASLTVAKGMFTVKYSGSGKNDKNRAIMIFDMDRHQLLKKELKQNYGKFSFKLDSIKAKTHGKRFQVYTVAIPKDQALAATVRVRPMLLCEVSWMEEVAK